MKNIHSFYKQTLLSSICALALSAPVFADETPATTITGHVDLVSKYILRGATSTYGNGAPLGNAGGDAPESDKAVAQWGADVVFSSGWSAGYWASMINYSYKQLGDSYSDRNITDFQKDKSIENDFYGAYAGTAGDLGYSVGMTGYYYINGSNANALETKLGLTYGAVSLNAQTLLNDVVWGNQGDTYLTLVYTKTLPYKITFTGTLGAYVYQKSGKFLGTEDTYSHTACAAGEAFVDNGCFAGNTPKSSEFRHLTLGFGGPFGDSPISWNAQYIIGGKNRFGIDQKDQFLGGLTYNF